MSKIICKGCGAILQTTDKDKEGYIEKIDESRKDLYCQRCYKLIHYNQMPKIIASNDDYEKIIDTLLTKKGLIILVVDIFDFTGTFIPTILNKLRNKEVILVANKLDLLPKSINVSKLVDWLSYMANRYFFKLSAINVVSSKKEYYIDELMNTISFLRNGRDIYFIGCANVGKSSLINCLLKRFTSRTNDLIATSAIPGTTLKTIDIPFFEDNKSFIDTPGLINENNVLSKLDSSSYNLIVPKVEIKPITYQIEKNNCVLLGAIASISLETNNNCSFTIYVSKNVTVHRRKDIEVLEFINKHKGEILIPPCNIDDTKLEFETHNFKMNPKQDIVFSGLGFVSVNKKCEIKVMSLKGLDVFIRNGIFGK